MMPAWLWLQERTPPSGNAASAVHGVLVQMLHSFREATRYRQLMRFLLTFFVYNLGTLAVVNFLSIIGREMGFDLGHLLLFAVVMAISAGLASGTTARFQDRLGHKRTVMSFLAFWVVAMLGIAGTQHFGAPAWTFWVISGITGLALGGIGTSTRAMVGAFTPAHRSAEFFGVWGMIGQASGILGVVAFGIVKQMANNQVPAILMLAAFFSLGFLLMLRINPADGIRMAREAETLHGVADIPD
jgi:UMF1 family MFS transporter